MSLGMHAAYGSGGGVDSAIGAQAAPVWFGVNPSKPTCHSRSTSPGSVTPPLSNNGDDSADSVASGFGSASRHQLDVSPFFVGHTFIDGPISRPVSLDEFLDERAAHSCPVTRLPSVDGPTLPPGLETLLEAFDEARVPSVGARSVCGAFPIEVKNTFIDAPQGRHMSLDGFVQERQICSCPASRHLSLEGIAAPPGLESLLEGNDETPTTSPSPDVQDSIGIPSLDVAPPPAWARNDAWLYSGSDNVPLGGYDLELPGGIPAKEWAPALGTSGAEISHLPPPPGEWFADFGNEVEKSLLLPPPPSEWAPLFAPEVELPPPTSSPGVNCDLPVLKLSEALATPEIGTPICPTQGSIGHHAGNCKPCAFLYTKGCNSGAECTFCHLCPPGEKRKRKTEKKEFRRAMREFGALHSSAYAPTI